MCCRKNDVLIVEHPDKIVCSYGGRNCKGYKNHPGKEYFSTFREGEQSYEEDAQKKSKIGFCKYTNATEDTQETVAGKGSFLNKSQGQPQDCSGGKDNQSGVGHVTLGLPGYLWNEK